MPSETRAEAPTPPPAASPPRGWAGAAVMAGAAVLIAATFLTTLHPGVEHGDSAELQYISVIRRGVCHPPGYPIQVLAGKLFTALPFGSPAWRINLMMAVCGVVGAVALMAAVRRITRSAWAGAIAGTTLAFSTVFWQHAVLAEVYAFFGMFLLLGIYFTVRFLQENRIGWLIAAAAALGICVGSRISELSVLPAFLLAWWMFRRSAPLTWRRVALCAGLLVAPFVFNLIYYVAREDASYLHARDDALRDRILGAAVEFGSLSFGEKLRDGVLYVTGLKWSTRSEFSGEKFGEDVSKLGWRLSGLGAFGERYRDTPQGNVKNMLQGPGTTVGALGLVLAAVGACRWRRHIGWPALGVLLFLGNTAFYFYHNAAPDNLDFTLPGAIGLALLAGLGAAGPDPWAASVGRRAGWIAACAAVPLFLLLTNYGKLDRSGEPERRWVADCALAAETPIDPDAVLIARYDAANMFRYIYWVQAEPQRRDVSVIIFRAKWMPDELARLVAGLRATGRPIYVAQDMWSYAQHVGLRMTRPNAELAKLGFLRVADR